MTTTQTRITDFIATLRGWRGKLACFIAGAATVAGFAPFHVWPIIFLTIPFLFLMLEKARHPRSAALYALAFGYGYTMAGTYWIANALLVDADQFGWLVPISILGLSLLFALWFALFGALVRWTKMASTAHNILRFAVIFVAVEYCRSFGPFGFPWNLLGSMALGSERIAQLASVTGTFGLSFFLVLLALLPVWWLKHEPRRMTMLAIALAAIILAYGYGMWRMPAQTPMRDVRVRVVQGNIPQSLKWTDQGRMQSAAIYSTLSRMHTDAPNPDIVLWPETAIPFTLHEQSPWKPRLSDLMPPHGLLLSGAVRSTGTGDNYKIYNSIVATDSDDRWYPPYDKHQLVPFGEFVPLRSVLPIEKITHGNIDFSRGDHAATMAIGKFPPFSPLICYEVIFPWLAVDHAHRPEWIFNATNDAWYGNSPGPYQHFDAARLRAIEQGLPLVRAANNGISAVIDPYGRAVKQLNLNERGIIDQALPIFLPATPYARLGEMITLTILILCWIATLRPIFRAKK